MAAAPLYTVQPDYRGNYLVVGPQNFFRKCDGFCEAHALAAEMNANHQRTQAAAFRIVATHFPLDTVPKGAA